MRGFSTVVIPRCFRYMYTDNSKLSWLYYFSPSLVCMSRQLKTSKSYKRSREEKIYNQVSSFQTLFPIIIITLLHHTACIIISEL